MSATVKPALCLLWRQLARWLLFLCLLVTAPAFADGENAAPRGSFQSAAPQGDFLQGAVDAPKPIKFAVLAFRPKPEMQARWQALIRRNLVASSVWKC